jgi:hypothetical protein
MRNWLDQEIRDIAKANDLRLRQATDLVTAFALGDLTADEAEQRLLAYQTRWDEALPGVYASPSLTDEQILEAIDRTKRGIVGQIRSNRHKGSPPSR